MIISDWLVLLATLAKRICLASDGNHKWFTANEYSYFIRLDFSSFDSFGTSNCHLVVEISFPLI